MDLRPHQALRGDQRGLPELTGFITILTTTATEAEAETIAETLLSEALAACVQILPIKSRYVWNGVVERQEEQLLLIKTRDALFDEVRGRIRTLHAYDTPEIIALPISDGDMGYLDWVSRTTQG